MSGYQPAANRYREIAVRTASPLQLVVMLYDGAIVSLREAQEHLKHKDIGSRSRCINRAIGLISELQSSLNFESGGSIAASLDRLYTYMKQRIFVANVQQQPAPLVEVAALLDNLRSAWVALVNQTSAPGDATKTLPLEPTGVLRTGTTDGPALSGLNISG
jgi:flagellar protein FliS